MKGLKNFELATSDVEEMNRQEMMNADGGCPFKTGIDTDEFGVYFWIYDFCTGEYIDYYTYYIT